MGDKQTDISPSPETVSHPVPPIAVWPPDDTDPMWQFRRYPDYVVVASRDGVNWIRMPLVDWINLTHTMRGPAWRG